MSGRPDGGEWWYFRVDGAAPDERILAYARGATGHLPDVTMLVKPLPLDALPLTAAERRELRDFLALIELREDDHALLSSNLPLTTGDRPLRIHTLQLLDGFTSEDVLRVLAEPAGIGFEIVSQRHLPVAGGGTEPAVRIWLTIPGDEFMASWPRPGGGAATD